jgi:hypothetical protein
MNAIDTNVGLYSHDTRDPRKQALAQQLIATTRPLTLPWQVGCEFVASSRKLAPNGFTEAQAWSALAAMEALADDVLLPFPHSGVKPKSFNRDIHFLSGMRCCWPAALVAV